jgi:hypothetical protein
MLNETAMACSHGMISVIENFQQAGGSMKISPTHTDYPAPSLRSEIIALGRGLIPPQGSGLLRYTRTLSPDSISFTAPYVCGIHVPSISRRASHEGSPGISPSCLM